MFHDPAAGSTPHIAIRPDDGATTGPETVAHATIADIERIPDPRICPFLRIVDDAERLGQPIEVPDPANRCVALRERVPQSLRQQELVCQSSAHVNCPRYLRGSLGAQPPVPVGKERAPVVTLTPATAGALALFVVAFLVSVAFAAVIGGMALTVVAETPTFSGGVLGAVETPPPTQLPTPAPTPERTPLPTETAAPTPTPAPTQTPEPTATPLPSETPGPTPSPTADSSAKPASDRYALLTACPDRSGCWIYRIRSGDNLYSIANYFGVSLKTIQAWNAWVARGLKAGRELRIPTPTR